MKRFKFSDPGAVMFTADTHFGHANIIRFCDRPYRDTFHMDESLVENWNQVVKPGQIVFHLGDFGFKGSAGKLGRLYERLNGKIILIQGNHDHPKTLKMFSEIHDLAEVHVGKQRIILCHYAMKVWPASHHGAWHLHGHSHGTRPERLNQKVLDIGVDSWNWAPVSLTQIDREMHRHGGETVDHHGTRRGMD